MSGLLNVISIQDVPETIADKYIATGTIGEVTTKEIARGYVAVSVPLEGVDKSGTDRKITARFNVRPEWFQAGFEKSEEYANYTDNEKTAYAINMKKLVRSLFAGAGLDSMDFDALEGLTVGFTVSPQSKDKSRNEVRSFFKP
jgi:hypothetical protein